MNRPALPDLPLGARIQDPFLIMDVEVRGGDNPFTVLTLGNATGRIQTAPFWASDSHRIAGITKGNVVQVVGTVRPYREQRQVSVDSLRVLPKEQVDWQVLLPSVGNVSRYWNTLDSWRSQLRGPRLACTLASFYDDPEFRARFEQCPASTSGHHAELGGLLKHTSEVAHIALATARLFDSADTELVLAGALLHDIGKLASYRWDGVFEMTVPGTVVGHVVLGSLMLDRRIRTENPMRCSEEELLLLQHLILSHHGKLEFGAPVVPLTLEAEILHYADFRIPRTSRATPASAPRASGRSTAAGPGVAGATGGVRTARPNSAGTLPIRRRCYRTAPPPRCSSRRSPATPSHTSPIARYIKPPGIRFGSGLAQKPVAQNPSSETVGVA